jgi:hypothetical protein
LFWRRCSLRPRGICGHDRATRPRLTRQAIPLDHAPDRSTCPPWPDAHIQGRPLRRGCGQPEDAGDDLAVFEHVVVIVAPTRGVAALEDQGFNRFVHRTTSQMAAIAARIMPTPMSAANINGPVKLGPRPEPNGCSSSLMKHRRGGRKRRAAQKTRAARKFSNHPRQRGRDALYDQSGCARYRNFLDDGSHQRRAVCTCPKNEGGDR